MFDHSNYIPLSDDTGASEMCRKWYMYIEESMKRSPSASLVKTIQNLIYFDCYIWWRRESWVFLWNWFFFNSTKQYTEGQLMTELLGSCFNGGQWLLFYLLSGKRVIKKIILIWHFDNTDNAKMGFPASLCFGHTTENWSFTFIHLHKRS